MVVTARVDFLAFASTLEIGAELHSCLSNKRGTCRITKFALKDAIQ